MKPIRQTPTLIMLALALVALALPATAEVFFIDMTNGTTFETRYRPAVAGWDPSKVVFVTSVGNRITLPKADIAHVRVDTEMRGFGTVIDTTTIALGIAPNDMPAPGEGADPSAQLLDYLQSRDSQQQDFTVDQFVNTEEAGGGGLPAAGWGGGNFGFGGGRETLVPGPRGGGRGGGGRR